MQIKYNVNNTGTSQAETSTTMSGLEAQLGTKANFYVLTAVCTGTAAVIGSMVLGYSKDMTPDMLETDQVMALQNRGKMNSNDYMTTWLMGAAAGAGGLAIMELTGKRRLTSVNF